jgi:F-type H+-transporting ATPase subunit epsilon
MAEKITFEVATPERLVISESVDSVILPSVEGSMGVLPGHAPLRALLDIGEMSYRIGGANHFVAVSGGFAEVLRDRVRVLAQTAERAEEIDLERARKSRDQAAGQLKGDAPSSDFHRWEVRLKRAISRIDVQARSG